MNGAPMPTFTLKRWFAVAVPVAVLAVATGLLAGCGQPNQNRIIDLANNMTPKLVGPPAPSK
jgi:hypothetical protein